MSKLSIVLFPPGRRSCRLTGVRVAKTWGVMLGAIALSGYGTQTALAQTTRTQAALAQAEIAQPSAEEAVAAGTVAGQTTPVAVSAIAPPANPAPAPSPFTPVRAGILDISKDMTVIEGVGHLRPSGIDASADGGLAWLESVNLPLYVTPGGEHWGWIYKGWLIPKGKTYLAMGRDASFAMVHSYKNLYTFPVLETRADGWFRVQYTPGGSAWAHTSQLGLGDLPLTVETWESRLQAQKAVYFLDDQKAQALRSQPQQSTNMISLVAADSLIEPLEFQGDWMRVRTTRPIANCKPLSGATVSEGWMRWRGGERQESLVWYKPNGGCVQ